MKRSVKAVLLATLFVLGVRQGLYAQEDLTAGSPSATVVDVENKEYVPLSPQQLRDSVRRAKIAALFQNKNQTVRYFDYFMQTGVPVFDTMKFPLNGFQVFDQAEKHDDFRNSRGSLGMPDQVIAPAPASVSGFTFRSNPFSSWFFTPENTSYLQTKNPYTFLFWVNNFDKNLNILEGAHYQNVARGLNLGIDFRVYDIYGAYNNSRSTQYNVRVSGNYISRDARYRLLFGYLYNMARVGENGGLVDDSAFYRNAASNRLRLQTYMSSAQNRWRENRWFFKQSYHFYSDRRDSIAENNRSYGYLAHEFDLSDNRLAYYDVGGEASSFYTGAFLNPQYSRDTLNMMKMTNRVYYSTSDMEYIPFGYRFKIAGGFVNEYVRYRNKVHFKDWVQWIPFARLQVDFADRFVFDAYADFDFGGYNRYDLSGRVMFKYLFPNDRERTLSKREGIGLTAGVNRHMPEFLYTYQLSNRFYWENDWRKNLELYADLRFDYKGWWFDIRASYLKNYVFMKKEGPVQADGDFWYGTFTAGKQLRFGKYAGMDNLLMLAYSGNRKFMHLPLFSMRESVYGVIPVKNIAEIHIGVEIAYNTSYYADGYMPATMSYYWQDEVKTGNFMVLNAYINFQVKRANIFIKGGNLLQGVTPYNYIQTPHYPLQDRNIRFGVSWRFFD